MYNTLWTWWHKHVCMKTQYRMTPTGLTRRNNQFLHKLQLPICKWLDWKAYVEITNRYIREVV